MNFIQFGNGQNNFENMPEAELRAWCKVLSTENVQLKLVLNSYIERLDSSTTENQKLTNIMSVRSQNDICNLMLTQEINELKENVRILVEENKVLKIINNEYKQKINSLEADVALLKSRDEPITIREAVRVLESCICLEVVGGSKTQFRKGNFNISEILKGGKEHELNEVIKRSGLTLDHLDTLRYLKDYGDYITHANRPKLTKREWFDMLEINTSSELDDDEDLPKQQKDLLKALERYFPCEDDDLWNIVDPVAKP